MSSETPEEGESTNPFEAFKISSLGDASPPEEPTESLPVADMVELADVSDGLSFLHPTSLIFELLSQVKSYLVPAAIGLFGAAKGDFVFIIISAVLFVPAFLTSVFRYFTYRYCIKDDHLVVRQGLIFRNARTVPVERIQNIDFVQNPLHRIFNVAEVKIETASGTKPEATMRVLSMAQMGALREAVFKTQKDVLNSEKLVGQEQQAFGDQNSGFRSNTGEFGRPFQETGLHSKTNGNTLLKIPLSWLVRAGLASNRGMLMVGVVTGLYFQFGGDRRNFSRFNFRWMQNLFPEGWSVLSISLAVAAGLLVSLIFMRLLGVGWFILRFFGYKLVQHGEDLRISCGLFTKVSATIPRNRIQFISIHRNLIMKWLGLASIRIETAGGAGNSNQSATESVSKRWFIPAIPDDQVPGILTTLRPNLEWDESKLNFRPMAPRTGTRLIRLAVIQSILIAGIGLGIWRPWGFVAGIIALPLMVLWAIKKSRSMRYARNQKSIVYRSGVFTKKTSMTFFEKIQALSIAQSPFDRRWKMATLLVDTAAAGQAEHRINVRFLDEQFAKDELKKLRTQSSHEQPVYG